MFPTGIPVLHLAPSLSQHSSPVVEKALILVWIRHVCGRNFHGICINPFKVVIKIHICVFAMFLTEHSNADVTITTGN
uniref:Uncharacterized protein n=1 Tax=Anguilla anguilla TaxID=7936 RepID=A0A0E9WUE8_ANGAN